jgi:hypothetical protein
MLVIRSITLLAIVLIIAGCATTDLRPAKDGSETVVRPVSEIPDEQLLDVWIELFDPGVLPDDEQEAAGLSMDIRKAEARFMPVHLRDTMEKTGYWGAVRVVPQGTEGAEILVRGVILSSDGQALDLEISALDATGKQWFKNRYKSEISSKVYFGANTQIREAFQPLYNTIANDLAHYRNGLNAAEISNIRRIAELRFAADLAPDAFRGYLAVDDRGRYSVTRLPAANDPMYGRIQAIRERDFMLIDTLNGHFDNFYHQMESPYGEWRRARSEEAEALKKIEREATTRKVLGFAAIAGAIALEALTDGNSRASTSTLRNVMVLGGAYAVKSGFDKDSETAIHRDAIEELDASFSAEAKPLVVEVEGETHELTGSAEAQYAQWRALLRRIYASETGLVDTDP